MELPPEVQAISSKFQRRMVERDFKKDFLNDLAQLQFDFLLIDLIDERLNLHLGPNGTACTLSSELLSSGFQSASYGGATINSGSEQFWRLWETGWEILLNKLRGLGILDRLVVRSSGVHRPKKEGPTSLSSNAKELTWLTSFFLECTTVWVRMFQPSTS